MMIAISLEEGISGDLATFFSISLIFFCIGLIIGKHFLKANRIISENIYNFKPQKHIAKNKSLMFAIAIVLLFTAYHYLLIGIPLFSKDIEELRFSFQNSGLLGIPSRLATYGPVVMILFATVYFSTMQINKNAMVKILILSLFLLMLQGHKSSPAILIIALIIAQRIDLKVKQVLKWFVVLVVPIILIYVYYVFKMMQSLNYYSFISYIVARFSIISITPIKYIYYSSQSLDLDLLVPSLILHDLIYPFAKIMGTHVETFNTQLSRALYGIKPYDFTVPVTPTFIGYFFVDFGYYGSFIAAFIVGYLCVWLYNKTMTCRNINALGGLLYLEYVMYVGLTSGNPFYLIPNALLALLLFMFFIKISKLFL